MKKVHDLLVHPFDASSEKEVPFAVSFLDQVCGHPRVEVPHRHTFYEILYVTGGQGTHVVDFEPYRLKTPSFYFISPGQVHFWRIQAPLGGCILMFIEDFLVYPSSSLNKMAEIAFFHAVGEAPELRLTPEQAKEIDVLMTSIKQEFQSEAISRASVLRAYLHILVVQLQRLFMSKKQKKNSINESVLVRKFKRLVADQFATERSIEAYAEHIGVSVSHLTHILKSMTGYSPGALIRNEIAMEAKRLLVHTELTISEVGYRLNFEDPSYFGRFFKRETGMMPSLFRQQIRKKYQIFPE
jgi:AraC family transcriptional activator of pobA